MNYTVTNATNERAAAYLSYNEFFSINLTGRGISPDKIPGSGHNTYPSLYGNKIHTSPCGTNTGISRPTYTPDSKNESQYLTTLLWE
jgi:hypothetical protein